MTERSEVTPTYNGSLGAHTGPHQWTRRGTITPNGENQRWRTCDLCGVEQFLNHTGTGYTESYVSGNAAAPTTTPGRITLMQDGTEIKTPWLAPGKTKGTYGVSNQTAADMGGIVAYDPRVQRVQFGDGSEADLDYLLRVNPHINSDDFIDRLETLHNTFFSPQELAQRITEAAEREKRAQLESEKAQLQELINKTISGSPMSYTNLQEKLAQMSLAITGAKKDMEDFKENAQPLLTPEDALVLIVEVVKNSGDAEAVRQAASLWLTRLTKEITSVVRALDDLES